MKRMLRRLPALLALFMLLMRVWREDKRAQRPGPTVTGRPVNPMVLAEALQNAAKRQEEDQ